VVSIREERLGASHPDTVKAKKWLKEWEKKAQSEAS